MPTKIMIDSETGEEIIAEMTTEEEAAYLASVPGLPEPETPVASILMLMLTDVTDVDETKPILEAMLMLLGGTPPEE